MRVGIYGGTFNPPHRGHLIVAESVRSQLSLDRVIFVPSFISPHKRDVEAASGEDRLEMLRLMVRGKEELEVSDCEVRREGVSYTVETLRLFHEENPKAELFLLVGMDNFTEFHTWRDPDDILEMATLVVMTRPGSDAVHGLPEEGSRVLLCRVPAVEVSSSMIRSRLQEGKSIQYLVPDDVRRYIDRRRLYRHESQR
jgi:nicotinate-nucleotide adenylyltransferase